MVIKINEMHGGGDGKLSERLIVSHIQGFNYVPQKALIFIILIFYEFQGQFTKICASPSHYSIFFYHRVYS